MIEVMGDAFQELVNQKDIIKKVIFEEETSFLRTLEKGIKLLDKVIEKTKQGNNKTIDGIAVFLLYDTYGFPYDLTELILREQGLKINKAGFDEAMQLQKLKSKDAAVEDKDDWIVLIKDDIEEFIGYDRTQADVKITQYRKVNVKGKDLFHLVFNFTPFYAESGGQVGDKGYIESANGDKVEIIDTQNEHNVIIHITNQLPADFNVDFKAVVSSQKRKLTMANHSATHLMHKVLRDILGEHVEQKGSLVAPKHLRFDFSHFQKMTEEEILKVEKLVNEKIRDNVVLAEKRGIPMADAVKLGATALFGEKYGDLVRVIQFNDSIELCGGTHVEATGEIGFFKILSESAIAAGIRRIEAVTSVEAEKYIYKNLQLIDDIQDYYKKSKNLKQSIEKTLEENKALKKQVEDFEKEKVKMLKQQLKNNVKEINGINVIAEKVEVSNAAQIKDMAFQLKGEIENLFFVTAANINGKVNLTIIVSDNLVKDKGLNAGQIIREISKEVRGGGGGQPGFASAGGSDASGIEKALEKAVDFVKN